VNEGLENRTRPYDPVAAGSIDGTDTKPHDHGIVRAKNAFYDPTLDPKIQGDPETTLFVARLNMKTTEETLYEEFGRYGKISHLRLVRDIVTGQSKRYAFICYAHKRDFEEAWRSTHHQIIDGSQILVEYERERLMKGWVPRRLGGGIGGKKESGQLRFGGRDRPFRVPFETEKDFNPLESDGVYDSRIGVVASIKYHEDDTQDTVVYMKQTGKKVRLIPLSDSVETKQP